MRNGRPALGPTDEKSGPRHRFAVRGGAIWSLPARLLVVVLGVELVSVLLVASSLASATDLREHGRTIAVLAFVGIVHTELALGIERLRRRMTVTRHVDLASVWTFAAALLLPPVLAVAVAVIVYLHLYARVLRPAKAPLHRHVFTVSTVVLAVYATAGALALLGRDGLFTGSGGFATLVVALLVYTLVQTALVVAVIVLSGEARVRQVLGRGDEVLLEIGMLSMGALTAGVIASSSPLHALLVLPALVILHRAVLVRQLEEQACTDGKTGLLNAAAWHNQAVRVLERARSSDSGTAVLILDLDHFKSVNDRYGHLAGDEVLASIATALRSEVRDDDLVGRFGGEEFVILLPRLATDRPGREPRLVAERIRQRIERLTVEISTPDGPLTVGELSVSIGGARFPHDGSDLPQLLAVADAALYAAKAGGRNAVNMGCPVHPVELPALLAPRHPQTGDRSTVVVPSSVAEPSRGAKPRTERVEMGRTR